MLCQGRSRITPKTVFQLTWCYWKTFVLTHKFGTAWAIEMTADREEWSELPIGATTATSTRSGTTVIGRSCVPPRPWIAPTTNWSQRLQLHDGSWSYNPTTHDDGHSNHPQTGKRHGHYQPSRQPLILVNNKNTVILVRAAVKTEHIKVLSYTTNPKENSISQQPHSNFGWRNAP